MRIINKKIRKLTVVRTFGDKPKALLPLSGRWLERAGFTIGAKVDIIVREECLVIIPSIGGTLNIRRAKKR